MNFREVTTDSYALWLVAFLVPALVVGALTDAVVEASVAACVLAGVGYLYFNYPF
ncbi:hypothetical protein HZS55_03165 [Halosimplex rubrum]|uniref:Uncharacterized protein n=1 Tax=Halosimplex rubrum TaxID=869889 RepID=A0A7D5NYC8_9EURY|nr:hypothetical protein [Halosimplex rubrum]QLH76363.1 hypothetical protein HZS55_03165 [Halosimplex rubrum]